MRPILLLCLTLATHLRGQTCVPEALHAYAVTRDLPSQLAEWLRQCQPDAVGTDLAVAVTLWNTTYPNQPLIVTYGADMLLDEPGVDNTAPQVIGMRAMHTALQHIRREDLPTQYNTPYLWLGICQGDYHMAIAYLHGDAENLTVQLVHPNTIDPSTKLPYTETLGGTEFFQRTYAMFIALGTSPAPTVSPAASAGPATAAAARPSG